MKKPVAFFLSSLMILNSLGFFILHLAEIRNCEIQARNFIGSENVFSEKLCTEFSSENKNFQVINSHEIISNGKIFDIVKIKDRDGKKIYFTISDEQEDNVISKILLVTAANSDNQSTPLAKFIPVFLKNLYDSPNENSICNCTIDIDFKYPFSKSLFNQTVIVDLISPPPENLS